MGLCPRVEDSVRGDYVLDSMPEPWSHDTTYDQHRNGNRSRTMNDVKHLDRVKFEQNGTTERQVSKGSLSPGLKGPAML